MPLFSISVNFSVVLALCCSLTVICLVKNTGVTVFLISLKAGGVALNLTEASMVFMMDSWVSRLFWHFLFRDRMPDRDVPCFSQWNPSVEYQAMDRIHRLGQKRPVKVIKLVIEDSIEDQIVQLQAKKLAMTEAALSSDSDSALGKLTVEDVSLGSLNDDMWRRLTLHSVAWVLVQVVEGLFV